jgi:carbonic anhydrase
MRATLPDAEWGGPPDQNDALPEPPQAAGWEWELDANGVPVRRLSTTASPGRGRRLRSDMGGTLSPRPAPYVAVVACMDSRLKIFELLGIGDEEAQVIRNAGGVVTDDVIRSLAVSQRLLGTTEIILIHHTDCGLQKITDDEFKREIEEETGIRPAWEVQAFTDATRDVRESIRRIKASPFLPCTDKIRGFVFDVATGNLDKVR